jgi:AcrR family transcriptional regulator
LFLAIRLSGSGRNCRNPSRNWEPNKRLADIPLGVSYGFARTLELARTTMTTPNRTTKKSGAGRTIDQITSGADVAKGTFYLHFPSKEDLLVALGERFATKHLIRIQSAIAKRPQEDWTGKLATWAEASAGFYLDSCSAARTASSTTPI